MPAFSALLPLMTPAPAFGGEPRDSQVAAETGAAFDAALVAAMTREPAVQPAPPPPPAPPPEALSAASASVLAESPTGATVCKGGPSTAAVPSMALASPMDRLGDGQAPSSSTTAPTPNEGAAATTGEAEDDPTRGAWWKGTAFEDFVKNGVSPVDVTGSLEEVYAQAVNRTTRPAGLDALTKAPEPPAEDPPAAAAAAPAAPAAQPPAATVAQKLDEPPALTAASAAAADAAEDDPTRGAWWKGTAFEDFVRNGVRPVDVTASLDEVYAQATARTTRPAGLDALTKAPEPPVVDAGDEVVPTTGAASPTAAAPDAPAQPAKREPVADGALAATAGWTETTFEPLVAFADATVLPTAAGALEREAAPPPSATSATAAGLAAELARRIENRQTRFEFALTPDGLGHVDVSVAIDRDGGLSASLTFDQAHAASELNARSGELRDALAEAGFDLPEGALSFASRDDSDSRRDGRQAAPAPTYGFGLGQLEDAAAIMPTPTLRFAARGGLDLRI